MAKVTDDGYKLPIIMPSEIVEVMTAGANCPLHIRGFDQKDGIKGEYVVKLRDSERMSDPAAALRELLAAYIGMEMEIPVAEPIAVVITRETAELTDDLGLKRRINNSLGYNFGTKFIKKGFQNFILRSSLPSKLLSQAQDIVAFDLLTQNPDRTNVKPNMLTNGEKLVAFDHEMAFSFEQILFAPANLWEQTGDANKWIDNLLLLPLIKGVAFDFDSFSQRMQLLDKNFWKCAESVIVDEWKHESYIKIKKGITDFVKHSDLFLRKLQIIMA